MVLVQLTALLTNQVNVVAVATAFASLLFAEELWLFGGNQFFANYFLLFA